MIIQHCKVIQEGTCLLFYKYDKHLAGYFICGILVEDTPLGKLSFAKLWKYFLEELVRLDDIYCCKFPGISASILESYTEFYKTIEEVDIYKVKNYLQHTPNVYNNFNVTKE